jgi:hypothetical protein
MIYNNTPDITPRPVCDIVRGMSAEFRRLSVRPSDYVATYLAPLIEISHLSEDYGYDTAVELAAYLLDGLSLDPDWTGANADALTRELRDQVAAIYGDDFDRWDEDPEED